MEPIYYAFALLLVLVGLIQSALLSWVHIAGVHPDLMLVVVISWSLMGGIRPGLIAALIGGIVLDLLSAAPFGVFTASLIGASLVSSIVAVSFFRSRALLPIGAALFGTLGYYGLSLILLYVAGHNVQGLDTLRRVVLPSLPINLVLIVIVFPAVRWLYRQVGPREIEW